MSRQFFRYLYVKKLTIEFGWDGLRKAKWKYILKNSTFKKLEINEIFVRKALIRGCSNLNNMLNKQYAEDWPMLD